MKKVILQIVSDDGVEASIVTDGSQDGAEDYFALVSVKESIQNKKIYGVDPVQSFALGIRLIETLTEEARLADGGDPDEAAGAGWRIVVAETDAES